MVAALKLGHVSADGFNFASEIGAEDNFGLKKLDTNRAEKACLGDMAACVYLLGSHDDECNLGERRTNPFHNSQTSNPPSQIIVEKLTNCKPAL